PIKGKVSHAFVFHVWPYEEDTSGALRDIGQSYLDALLGGGGGAGAPGGPGGDGRPSAPPGPGGRGGPGPGAPGPGGDAGGAAAQLATSWVPLTGSGGG